MDSDDALLRARDENLHLKRALHEKDVALRRWVVRDHTTRRGVGRTDDAEHHFTPLTLCVAQPRPQDEHEAEPYRYDDSARRQWD
jgi:hypothetical protein